MSYCNNLLNTVTSVTVRTVRYIHAATSIPYGFTYSYRLQRSSKTQFLEVERCALPSLAYPYANPRHTVRLRLGCYEVRYDTVYRVTADELKPECIRSTVLATEYCVYCISVTTHVKSS